VETFCWWLCRTWSSDFLLGLDFDFINYYVYRFLSWFVMSVLCCVLLYDFVHCLLLRRNNKYITFSTRPSVRPLPIWIRYFENEWNDFAANWQKWSVWQRDEMTNSGGQEVKGQGHTTPKLDLETWRRHRSRHLRSSSFSS